MSDLSGKCALITGAGSQGIGRATALQLAKAGADIAIHHYKQFDQANDLVEQIKRLGRRAIQLSADLGEPENARTLVQAAISQLGGLDICVCCAATLERVGFLDITDEQWRRVHAVNLHGYFAISQEAAKHMAQKRSGRIVMVSSVNQAHPTRELAHYVSSKGGVMMLARAMALELAPLGITVNLVAPGTVVTDINRKAFDDPAFKQSKLDLIPMQQLGAPDDIAAAVLYLVSR